MQSIRRNEPKLGHWQHIKNEFTLCAARERRGFLDLKRPASRVIVLFNILAQSGSLLSVIYGSIVLSSLLFIGVSDSFQYVFRYFLSALACRVVLIFELGGMIVVENEDRGEYDDELDESIDMTVGNRPKMRPERKFQSLSHRYQTL